MNNFSILLYPKEAQKFLGGGPTTFYELAKRSDFPKPKSPLGKRVMYRRDELEKGLLTPQRNIRSHSSND